MKCEEVRVHLAAYRRSDWSVVEQRAVSQHLATCNACRRWEAEARRVGEHLRQLPTITPPASLRENVLAAIQREAIATPPLADPVPASQPMPQPVPIRPVAAVSASPYAITRPLAVATSERVGEVAIGRMRPPRVLLGKHTAIATVAALFLIMFTARFFPFTHSAPNIQPLSLNHPTPAPYSVQADTRYPKVLSAIADDQQVIYVGESPDGQQHMLLAQERQGSQWQALLPQPMTQSITIVALTHTALYWIVDANKPTWTLQVAPFADGLIKPVAGSAITTLLTGAQQITDASSATATPTSGAPAASGGAVSVTVLTLTGLWAQDHTVLFTAQTADNRTALAKVDLPNGQNMVTYTIITQAQTGHTLLHPYLADGAAYWVDKTLDAVGTARGDIWEADAQHSAHSLGLTADAFGPVAAGSRLAWFQVQQPSAASANVDSALLGQVSGSLTVRANATAPAHALAGNAIAASQVWRGQGYLLWRDSAGNAHMYVLADDLTHDVPLPGHFDTLALSPTSIAWSTTPANTDAPAQGAITVVDLP